MTNQLPAQPPATQPAHPTFGQALQFWIKLGFISFGGPTGQIAIMQQELVDRRRWIGESRFLHALNFCMTLPGPEAQQLAIYIGWLLHGTWGGLAAGTLFVLPAAVLLWILSWAYVTYGQLPVVDAVVYGLKPVVVAIVASAGIKVARRALRNWVMGSIALAAFVGLFFLSLPFPLIIGCAAAIGLLGGRRWRSVFSLRPNHNSGQGHSSPAVIDDDHELPPHQRPTRARALRVLAVCMFLWWTPVLAAGLTLGWDHVLVAIGVFFSKVSMVTFGGAYAVLPYVAQQAVGSHHWLTPEQMLAGMALAETTPGPLIIVLQHVGFLGGYHLPGPLHPTTSATLGALMTTWVTFVPCFLWILLLAPYVEAARRQPALAGMLAAITAAVVGVIANLALWFALHVFFPANKPVDFAAMVFAAAAMLAMIRWKIDAMLVIAVGAVLGMIYRLVLVPQLGW